MDQPSIAVDKPWQRFHARDKVSVGCVHLGVLPRGTMAQIAEGVDSLKESCVPPIVIQERNRFEEA
jgi:hypothetical protein